MNMKRLSILFILAVCLLDFGCVSARKSQEDNKKPKWNPNLKNVFPDAEYVAAFADGNSVQQCNERAAAKISDAIKAHVSSSTASLYFENESKESFTENNTLKENIKLSSNNNLYLLEYTNPYYDEEREKYACVAYINRNEAFNYIRPILENAKNQFPKACHTALRQTSLLDRIIGIKRSLEILPDFYEVYDFARYIQPEKTKVYEELDLLANDAIIKLKDTAASVVIKIQGTGDTDLLENSGFAVELANQFNKMGFTVIDSSKANCLALVGLKAGLSTREEIFEAYPEIHIRIIENNQEKISYNKQVERVAASNKSTVMTRIKLALIEELNTSFIKECF